MAPDVNLALARPAYQSSTYVYNSIPLAAALAVDGDYNTDAFLFHCANGQQSGGAPNWLAVDIGITLYIDRVVLTNRNKYREYNVVSACDWKSLKLL